MRTFTKTVSEKQLAANQANGAQSHGPVSEAGKAISSQNARRHGLCGRFKVLACENQHEFDDLFDQFVQDEQPVGSIEVELVRRMAEYTWLRDRVSRMQAGCFRVCERTEEHIAAGTAEIAYSPALELFLRYQAHFDRSFARASAELQKRRKERWLRENRFVSQKRAEASDRRTERYAEMKEETHSYWLMKAQCDLELKKTRVKAAQAA